jgi:hypothetical protein
MESLKADALELQERDLAVLRGLFESRVMTAGLVATLFFAGKRPYSKKRLQKLKGAGLIGERKRRVNEPSVLFLTGKAFGVMKTRGLLSEYPRLAIASLQTRASVSEMTLRHELEVMDVKAAFHAAVRARGDFAVAEFSTWPTLYQFEASRLTFQKPTLIKPDGFIRIREGEIGGRVCEDTFFLEVDRSTESQNTLLLKASAYTAYYRSGGFARKNGAECTEYKRFPFRVLMVFKTRERRNNVAARLLQQNPPILKQVYLSTLEEVKTDPFGAIWMRPIDFRDVTLGTSFGVAGPKFCGTYRRQGERDAFIESRVHKHSCIDAMPSPEIPESSFSEQKHLN